MKMFLWTFRLGSFYMWRLEKIISWKLKICKGFVETQQQTSYLIISFCMHTYQLFPSRLVLCKISIPTCHPKTQNSMKKVLLRCISWKEFCSHLSWMENGMAVMSAKGEMTSGRFIYFSYHFNKSTKEQNAINISNGIILLSLSPFLFSQEHVSKFFAEAWVWREVKNVLVSFQEDFQGSKLLNFFVCSQQH